MQKYVLFSMSINSILFSSIAIDPQNHSSHNSFKKWIDFPFSLKIFTGNVDRNTIVTNTLPVPQMCRYVRLMPVSWVLYISLRMEIYGEGPFTGQF